MQSEELDKTQAGTKIAERNINNLRYEDDTTLIPESKWKLLSHVLLFAAPWAVQSMEFSRPEYWSR